MRQLYDHDGVLVRMYELARLQFNILEHNLVPLHKPLTKEEKLAVSELYNVNNDSEFPEISRFDPVAIAVGLRPGELCKIVRNSQTAIEGNYYRLCI